MIVAVVVLSALLLLLAVAWSLRKYVCFRRKECCGKGCGCLFPVKR